MEAPRRQHNLLLGTGLVLIGLLGGILFMWIYSGGPPRPTTEFSVVERVDLGGHPQVAHTHTGALGLNDLFWEVADRVMASVVSVQVESGWMDVPRDWFHGFGQRDDEGREHRDLPRESVGSGVVITKQGHIVTNYHVVDRARGLRVTLVDKREFDAEFIGSDRSTDIAVLKIELADGEEVKAIPLGEADRVRVGEWVLAVGNPFQLNSTITAGIVSALGRQVNIIDDDFFVEDFIQTDAAINPGSSGGALVNLHGELVGISTAIATEGGSNEGYGFAIPVSLVERVAMDLIHYGEMQRGYLGVTIVSVDASYANDLGLERIGGVYLDAVQDGSAAARGGLQQGDVVLAVAGRAVNASNELQSTIARHRPGDKLAVDYWRGGRLRSASVRLLGKDDPFVDDWLAGLRRAARGGSDVFHIEGWGFVLREMTGRERRAYGEEKGVVIAYVVAGSSAAKADIPRSAIITAISLEPVTSVEDAVRLLRQAAETAEFAEISVRLRDGSTARYEVAAPEVPSDRE